MDAALDRIEAGLDRWRGGLPLRGRLWVIYAITAITVIAAFLVPPFPQPLEYHLFADARTCFGIPNFANTVSNAAFLVVGLWGMAALRRPRPGMFEHAEEVFAYRVLFVATALIAVGSAYYHLDPNNDTLFWDRLPMVIGFGALIGAMAGERIDRRAAQPVLYVAVAVGVATLVYWLVSEHMGAGNLMPYALFQGYSILVALLILALFPSRYTRGRDLFAGLALYGVAKVAEALDEPIFAFGQLVSGHTLKHLLAAAGLAFVLRMLLHRVPKTRENR
jgi:hypothetical protein